MQKYQPGDNVQILSLKKTGTVQEILRSGRIKVVVGGLSVTCSTDEIIPANRPKNEKKSTSTQDLAHQPAIKSITKNKPKESLDLHGKTVTDALRLLGHWLDQVIRSDLNRVVVIHGHGTGKIQSAVHSYLGSISTVKSFKINEFNSGETIVYL